MSSVRRWIAANWPVLAAGLLAAAPVILSTAHTLAVGWHPLGDDAIIAARSYDVFTTHPPLTGAYSATSVVLGEPSHHPGPLLFWLLAIPARWGGPAAMTLTVGLVNAAAAFGCVAVARRRGGLALMVVAASTIAAASASIVLRTYSDVWNPAAGLLPFTLLIFLTWSMACGDVRLLPLGVLVASFALQCHLAYLPAVLGMTAVAIVGLVAARVRPSRRSLVAAGVVLLVCWSGPLVDEIAHRPGNAEVLVRTAFSGTPTLGFQSGARAVTHTIGVPPWWLGGASGTGDRIGDIIRAPSALSIASAIALLAALAALAVLGWRRGRRDVALAAGQALVLCAAIGTVAGGNPTKGLLTLSLGYNLWWGTAAGAWAWLTLAVGGLVLFGPAVLRRLKRPAALGGLATLGAALAIARLAAAGPGIDPLQPRYAPMSALADRLEAALPAGRTVLVDAPGGVGFSPAFDFQMGSVYALRRHGDKVITAASAPLGSAYEPRGKRADYVLTLARGTTPRTGAEVLMHIPPSRAVPGGLVATLRALDRSSGRGLERRLAALDRPARH
jgi:hypothetical protein